MDSTPARQLRLSGRKRSSPSAASAAPSAPLLHASPTKGRPKKRQNRVGGSAVDLPLETSESEGKTEGNDEKALAHHDETVESSESAVDVEDGDGSEGEVEGSIDGDIGGGEEEEDGEAAETADNESERGTVDTEQAGGRMQTLKSGSWSPRTEGAVVYVSRLPRGFEEAQLQKFFSQFGEIVKLRLMRSLKTGNSKHHAFIHFAVTEVAKIAATTMDKYIMFGKALKAECLPLEKVVGGIFGKKFKKRSWRPIRKVQKQSKARTQHNKPDGVFSIAQLTHQLDKAAAKRETLKALGINFEPPSLAGSAKS